jgi:alpha-tubulin suppressor-like RCC1 family protein
MNEQESPYTNSFKQALHYVHMLEILGILMLGGCDAEPERDDDGDDLESPEPYSDDDLIMRHSDANGPVISSIDVSLGRGTTCMTTPAGDLKCWGRNEHGQLGRGHRHTLGDDETPDSFSFVALESPIAEVQTNGLQTFVRTTDGRVQAWGANQAYELGLTHAIALGDDETPASATVTTEVQIGGVAAQLAVGEGFACVRLDDGGVRCWGTNEFGQLGQGHTEPIGDDEAPMDAPPLALGGRAIDITAGAQHACAVLDGGRVRCWGRGQDGQLGHSATTSIGDDELPTSVPEVELGAVVVKVVTGGLHTCALLDSGSIRCWGRAQAGQLGHGDVEAVGDDETPAAAGDVPVGGMVVSLAAGWQHTCAVLAAGTLRCWGNGELGQLGLGHTETIGDDEIPAIAGNVDLGEHRASAVFIGPLSTSTCVLLEDGNLRCWGDNDVGQLGYGHTLQLGDEPYEGGGDLPDIILLDDDDG